MILYKIIAEFYLNSGSIGGLPGASYAKYAEFYEGLVDTNIIHVGFYGTCTYSNIIPAYIPAGRGCITTACGCIPAGCGYISGIGVEFSGQSAEMPVTCIGFPAMFAGAGVDYAEFTPGYAAISMVGVGFIVVYVVANVFHVEPRVVFAGIPAFCIDTGGLYEDTDEVWEGIDFLQFLASDPNI